MDGIDDRYPPIGHAVKNEHLRLWQKIFAYPTILVPAAGLVMVLVQTAQGRAGTMEVTLLLGMYLLVATGITVGFHRYLTHRSFKTGNTLRAIFAILGSMAALGPVISWVSNHRRHHRYSDRAGDPHSPYITNHGQPLSRMRGFWHSYNGWLLDGEITNAVIFAKDLLRDPIITRINRTYLLWVFMGLAIPSLIGWLWRGTMEGAFQGLLWGGLARVALNQQALWIIASLAHIFGSRPFNTGEHEQSRNNMLFTLVTLGDGWHNNHHAFPHVAIMGFEWWQIDPSTWIIRSLEKLGIVWDVQDVPDKSLQRQKLRSTKFES